ncbi:MAG: lipopolysaccharide biosynthesis protein [Mesorhizobium sp.]|uniref:lipopolysaccharide biosynthesis protein n=1 Tax=Mesorhizobium sp. TaxID=1871066 RepID=UPI000FEAB348|nr:lipopolysaccharide biosynthesis protein [Mesorhizobium sp.]RWH84609.1 MAG: lipopolysaccharide biosynthesis protein [Mesorhizobium sp.]RWH86998.1 MAG: lipopolysaccharide biosynthesis protein [Mesorhizobium sp.]RWH93465.1 MAG: lipopolysaccharide biosynthesis protein [Mesorhizobium sp.]RWI03079.1 MAG: lipopolysaccharide biosynthesis protein [Mesorhizobium sp.]RWI05587.1 MAG: lipopolysaccharide biosynthesis protein [Mesorhizobium sp.]
MGLESSDTSESRNLTHKATRGLSWSGGMLLVRTLLNVGVAAVLARLLSPQEYGVVGAAMIVGAVGNSIANLGMSQVAIQRRDIEERHIGTVISLSMLIATILGLLQWIFARQIADFLHVPELILVSRVLAVMMVANAFNLMVEAILSRHLKFKISSVATLVAWIASHVGLAIPLAYLGFSYWALVVAYMAEALILASIYSFIARDYLVRPSFDMQSYRDIRRQSLGYSLAGISTFTAKYIDNVIVARLIGTAELGIYSRAYYLVAMPANLFGNLNKSVVFPLLSKVHHDKARLCSAQLKGYALTAALALPTSAFLCCFAKEIVLTILGQKWTDAVVPIIIFSAVIYFRVGYRVCGAVTLATGQSYRTASMQIIYMALVASFAFFSAPYGVNAVAFSVSGAIATSFFLYAAMTCRITGLSALDFALVHVPPVAFAAVVFATGSAVKMLLAGSPDYLVLATGLLVIGTLSVVTVYLRASLLFGKYGAEVLQSLTSKKTK